MPPDPARPTDPGDPGDLGDLGDPGDVGDPVATFDVWGVPLRRVPRVLRQVARSPRAVGALPGLAFAKAVGTARGFTAADADLRHWGVFAVWSSSAHAAAFPASPLSRAWQRLAHEHWHVTLEPRYAHGSWSRATLFDSPARNRAGDRSARPPSTWPRGELSGRDEAPPANASDVPVAVLTRARLRLRSAPAFWRATPPVAAQLAAAPGVRFAFGFGEAPLGFQGTFSVWESIASMREFAYRGAAHRTVVSRTRRENWYAEELFATFVIRHQAGTLSGAALDRSAG